MRLPRHLIHANPASKLRHTVMTPVTKPYTAVRTNISLVLMDLFFKRSTTVEGHDWVAATRARTLESYV